MKEISVSALRAATTQTPTEDNGYKVLNISVMNVLRLNMIQWDVGLLKMSVG